MFRLNVLSLLLLTSITSASSSSSSDSESQNLCRWQSCLAPSNSTAADCNSINCPTVSGLPACRIGRTLSYALTAPALDNPSPNQFITTLSNSSISNFTTTIYLKNNDILENTAPDTGKDVLACLMLLDLSPSSSCDDFRPQGNLAECAEGIRKDFARRMGMRSNHDETAPDFCAGVASNVLIPRVPCDGVVNDVLGINLLGKGLKDEGRVVKGDVDCGDLLEGEGNENGLRKIAEFSGASREEAEGRVTPVWSMVSTEGEWDPVVQRMMGCARGLREGEKSPLDGWEGKEAAVAVGDGGEGETEEEDGKVDDAVDSSAEPHSGGIGNAVLVGGAVILAGLRQ